MKIYSSLKELPQTSQPVIATIGNFDGVHRGHRWVIQQVIERARALNCRSLVITFDPHPSRILRPENSPALLTPLPRKLELLADTGIDGALVLPFNQSFSQISAREFAITILKNSVNVTEIHEGENFRFGHHAEAGIDNLQSLGQELGFAVRAYTPQILRHHIISSSRIRQLIHEGNVSESRALLGYSFCIEGTPASGRGYGRRYTVPTINLAPYTELLPAYGVYATTLQIRNEIFQAVTNIGNRPTFGEDSFSVESHLLNFHPVDLDDSTPLRLTFLKYLRPEIRWPHPEALKHQINIDIARAQRFFSLRARLAC